MRENAKNTESSHKDRTAYTKPKNMLTEYEQQWNWKKKIRYSCWALSSQEPRNPNYNSLLSPVRYLNLMLPVFDVHDVRRSLEIVNLKTSNHPYNWIVCPWSNSFHVHLTWSLSEFVHYNAAILFVARTTLTMSKMCM